MGNLDLRVEMQEKIPAALGALPHQKPGYYTSMSFPSAQLVVVTTIPGSNNTPRLP